MSITAKTIKILWANSAGLCSFCKGKLTMVSDISGNHSAIGEMAHIKGEKLGANRHDPNLSDVEINDYKNLILLCPTHHTLIDKKEQESTFTVEVLSKMKKDHISYVETRVSIEEESIEDVKRKISALLAENHVTWQTYGPQSEIARKNPQNEQAHELWVSKRLSTIVPNNRAIVFILNSKNDLFLKKDNEILSRFKMHVESYEAWVQNQIEYTSVLRFPIEFETLINS